MEVLAKMLPGMLIGKFKVNLYNSLNKLKAAVAKLISQHPSVFRERFGPSASLKQRHNILISQKDQNPINKKSTSFKIKGNYRHSF